MGKLFTFIAALACVSILAHGADFKDFAKPDDGVKPWCYWWWVNGNVDKETMTADLEDMKKIGFGGCLMFDARGYWDDPEHLVSPKPACSFMDETWRGHFKYAISEASRLGLEMSANLSSCAGRLKGPWNLGADAPKRLICKISPLPVNHKVSIKLQRPNRKYAWNIAVFAIKYDGEKIEKSSDWLNAGDGLYSMMATSGMKIGGSDIVNREALEVVNVADKIDNDGVLHLHLSDGNWALAQFCCTTLDDHDFDVDVLDKSAVERYYKRMAGALKDDLGELFASVLTHFYSVSWEGSVPTWTGDLPALFKKYAGYDIEKWIPVLAGFYVEGKQRSDKFMTDFRRARNLCFRDNFYQAMIDLAHAEGLLWHAESGGPWSRKPQIFGEADQLSFLGINDMPQGEFWVSKDERYLIKPIANAAHIYGRNIVAVESFTHMRQHWSVSPAMLKGAVDNVFCDGANQVIWHTYTCSPKSFGKPGIEYFAGTHINRNVTWHSQVAPFLEYIARCQYMLRQGLSVADFCAYVGDMPYQGWGRWKDKLGENSKIKIPAGFNYDILNNDVLLNYAKVIDGKLVLPDGLAFKAMIVELDSPLVSPRALEKILEFKAAGLPVVCVGSAPEGAAGLSENSTSSLMLGRKLFADSTTLDDFINRSGILPDYSGKFNFAHRKDANGDIYFVSGSGTSWETFRTHGVPELWNPVDGSRVLPKNWRQNDNGTTSIEINLPENGSVFVVFANKADLTLPIEAQEPKIVGKVEGAWNVEFEEGRGAPKSAVFEKLEPLNENKDESIRYFSGVAKYSKEIDIKKTGVKMYLELTDVCVVAEVFLNGKNCSVAWTAPWRVDITDAVIDGTNKLEICVANTWVNRLIADASLPPEKRVTKSNMSLSKEKRKNVYSGFSAADTLQKSGLCGEVRLLSQ